jgi:hypothetical protein
MNTRGLTGNRDRDKGWTQSDVPTLLWTPSIHDRRRIAVAEVGMMAEASPDHAVTGVTIGEVLKKHSRDDEDFEVLAQNFTKWMHAQQH